MVTKSGAFRGRNGGTAGSSAFAGRHAVNADEGRQADDASRADRGLRRRRPFRRCLSRSTLHPADADTGIVFVRTRRARAGARSPRRFPRRHRHRIRHRPRRRHRHAVLDRRTCAGRACAASASTTPSSRSTARKCRSWTAARRRSSPRSIRPASSRSTAPRRYIKVLKPVRVAKGDAFGELRPYARGFRLEVEIDFDHPLIGRQSLATRPRARQPSAANCPAPAPSAS